MSTNSAVSEETVRRFANGLRGRLILPADSEYETARRVANPAIDRRPAMIVRCAGREDVVRAIEFARTHDLVVAVRGGGHSFAGKSTCDGGMVIDLSTMKNVRVDPLRRTAIAGPGATLGDLDEATQQHGLVTPLGTVPQTGIAGLTLGGGIGWILGKYGLSCDNLQSVEIVKADGRTLTASAEENEDLFWGFRGGGGNFGVVTSFEYRLHPLTHVLAGTLVYRKDDVRRVLRFVRAFTMTTPDELVVYAGAGPIGLESRCSVYVCYCGDPEAGERVLTPLRRFGSPLRARSGAASADCVAS
jgi:FAD/FMN-containing dehydrogenase